MEIIQQVEIKTKYYKIEPFFWLENKKTLLYKKSNGLLVKYKNKYYVIACYHGIENYKSIEAIISINRRKSSYNMKELDSIFAYDFSVLEFIEESLIFSSIDTIKKEYYLNNLKKKVRYKLLVDNTEYINCKYNGYYIDSIKSKIYPKIPLIKILIKDKKHYESYQGTSGSLLLDNKNNIYGMVSYYDIIKKNIICIPMYCINKFFKIIVNKKKISTLLISTKLCDYNKNNTGHIITNNNNIKYMMKEDSKFNFKENDIITSINNIKFNNAGYIHFKNMNIFIPLNTYLMLNNNNFNTINFYRKDKIEYKENIVKIKNLRIEKYNKFSIKQNLKIIKFNNLSIIELSENLLMELNSNNIKILGQVNNEYENCYGNNKILAIINYDMKDNNYIHKYKNINIPIKNDKINTNCNLAIISKVNNTKIKSLNQLDNIIKKESITSIKLVLDENKFYTINYK
jgi:hypothetical protein